MALGDFNGDHIPDLVVTSYINSRQAGISIFLGNGDGTFKPALTYLAGYNVRSLATADMMETVFWTW